MLSTPINISASGDNVVIPGVAGSTYNIYGVYLLSASGVSVTVKNGASVKTGPLPLTAAAPFSMPLNIEVPYLTVDSGNGFILNLSGAVQVSGIVYFQTLVVSS